MHSCIPLDAAPISDEALAKTQPELTLARLNGNAGRSKGGSTEGVNEAAG
jgi:hypothetical protein